MPPVHDTDYILVGGGLQNALLVSAIHAARPEARIIVLERGPRIGGNHTWSFHAPDLNDTTWGFVEPLVQYRWPGYEVALPNRCREFHGGYCTITSEHLDKTLRDFAATSDRISLVFGCEVRQVNAQSVTLSDGTAITARAVIDARGPGRLGLQVPCGYQKFVGLEVRLARPAPRSIPLLKDNTVPQTDGYRFVYVLPFTPERVLIEDTYYSDTPYLDEAHLEREVLAYADRHGYDVAEVLRRESGALPIPRRYATPPAGEVLQGGYAGGWFHPTTGYSFPIAARLAAHVAAREPEAFFDESFAQLARRQRSQARFCTFLNRMLFEAYPPEKRWHVLERFHRLPQRTIERFYALDLTPGDRWRILAGRPPKGLSLRYALKGGMAT